jgi:hypothetical protein
VYNGWLRRNLRKVARHCRLLFLTRQAFKSRHVWFVGPITGIWMIEAEISNQNRALCIIIHLAVSSEAEVVRILSNVIILQLLFDRERRAARRIIWWISFR